MCVTRQAGRQAVSHSHLVTVLLGVCGACADSLWLVQAHGAASAVTGRRLRRTHGCLHTWLCGLCGPVCCCLLDHPAQRGFVTVSHSGTVANRPLLPTEGRPVFYIICMFSSCWVQGRDHQGRIWDSVCTTARVEAGRSGCRVGLSCCTCVMYGCVAARRS